MVGAAHLESFLRYNTPMFVNLYTSVFRVSLCILGIGKDLVWYGLAPSKSLILYSEPVYLPNVPSTFLHVSLTILGVKIVNYYLDILSN